MSETPDGSRTALTKARYDRLARFFDFLEAPVERLRFGGWRSRLKDRVKGPKVLEVGTGTGKNMSYYPAGAEVTAIDLSPKMLNRAKRRASEMGLAVDLLEMDAQALDFPDHSFDTVFATFVFCSVPDPVKGLRELRRVTRPAGRLVLLEHMRPEGRVLGALFDAFNPIAVRLSGANINRRTMENIRAAGWIVEVEDRLSGDVVRWVEARPGGESVKDAAA